MIQINLLPRHSKKRKVTVRQISLGYLLCIATSIIMMLGIWMFQRSEIDELQGRLARVEEEVRQLAKYEALLMEVTKRKQIIDKKCQIITELQRDRDTMARLMAVISAEVPAEKIWLEKLVQSANSMTLNGVALSNESIAEFMRNIESSPYVIKGTVNLTHSRQTLISNLKLREFQITYQYVPFSQVQKLHGKEGT
jgi:type IV pilus assembly protein PilN